MVLEVIMLRPQSPREVRPPYSYLQRTYGFLPGKKDTEMPPSQVDTCVLAERLGPRDTRHSGLGRTPKAQLSLWWAPPLPLIWKHMHINKALIEDP